MATKKQPKKIITEMVTDVSPYEMEGTLQQVLTQVQQWIVDHGPDARLNWDGDHWPQYSDSPSPRYEININREETDVEYQKRIADETLKQTLQDARDRKELERLQAKFGAKK
jgi:hypothetical protein